MTPLAVLLALAATERPPADWSGLPDFPVPPAALVADGATFVREEVGAARCPPQPGAEGAVEFAVPVAILVTDAGRVRRITPKAVGCPTVKQYTVG